MDSPLVVGVDGSDTGLTAVDWAADEAARHGWALRIVHASLWERYEGVAPAWTADRPVDQILAESIVAAAEERALRRRSELTVTTDVLAEDAVGGLLAEGERAAALVVGSRGRSRVAGLLLGSVSLTVAARASCPVIVVRGDQEARETRHHRVLLGIGGDETDAPAARFAWREAAVRDAELEMVHAWRRPMGDPSGHPLLADRTTTYERSAAALLDRAVEGSGPDRPQVRLRRSPVEGPAHHVLVERSAAADLLVIGARRRRGFAGLEIGRVAHRALHHAACPVAVVPWRAPETADGDA